MAHLVNLNVERSQHLDRFMPFLAERKPDIVCLQELDEGDIPRVMAETGLSHCHFVPMARLQADNPHPFGVAILTHQPPAMRDFVAYVGDGSGTDFFDRRDAGSRVATCRYAIARITINIGGEDLTIANTHFPWTPDGQPRPFQMQGVEKLIGCIGDTPVVLTGDFNAPRGGPVFNRLAEAWRDCIPPHITTSIDPDLHRAGPLDLMVDGIFASPHYAVHNVEFHRGLSDHQAISASVTIAN